MRLHFKLSPNQEPVPFNYQHFLIGAFHKWLGPNEIHDDISLYSLSWLSGGKKEKDMLNFPQGAKWFISCWNEELANKVELAVLHDPFVCCGMQVKKIMKQEAPEFGNRYRFKVASPILVKEKNADGTIKHLIFSDGGVDEHLTKSLVHKLDLAGLPSESAGLKIYFDKKYKMARTRLVTIKQVKNRASLCPVIVEGTEKALQFAWTVGIGNSTGSGFGALL
jgi:CRISPR-associated endoribonuclease Cas6